MSTIKEVAGMAGVSIGTVSHVISGTVPVSDLLKGRVLEAIRLLDYHPNHIARSLKTRRTCTLGIVIPDMTIPFFPKVIRGAETAAQTYGYSVIAIDSNDDEKRQGEVVSLLRSQRVEGILLVVASGEASLRQVARLVESGLPVVCLDRLPGGVEVDSVCVDDRAGAELGVHHLIENGYRRIAILSGPLSLKNEHERLRGYKRAIERAGLQVTTDLIWKANLRQEDAVELCRQKLNSASKRPAALFSTNGVLGMGALRAITESGLETPTDIGFVTFDELTSDDVFRPSITSVVQPAYEIGFQATEILMQRIQSGSESALEARIAVRLPASLKIRESSGKLARSRRSGV